MNKNFWVMVKIEVLKVYGFKNKNVIKLENGMYRVVN